ncbi:hypothetical protein [Candidatus Poriferisodalis sp.]|uniref:hypothetical protein n=1 Tax=Candidatus Poriferisodalis sp. TaxID=3101277 RepID=UPI003B014221
MTLTASLPTKALASLLAALLLSTTLAVALPARTELPSVLSALDVATADAHSKPHCYDETVPVRNMDGTGETRTTTRRVCVELAHSHWYRPIHMGAALGGWSEKGILPTQQVPDLRVCI